MATKPEVERLLGDIDKVIAKYSSSKDRETQKVVRRLKRRRQKLDRLDGLDAGFKILVIADKLKEWIDKLS